MSLSLRPRPLFPVFTSALLLGAGLLLGGCAAARDAAPDAGFEPTAPRFGDEQLEQVRARLQAFADESGGGVTVGIRSGEELVLLEGFGPADEARNLSADTVLELGSVTKQFTAALVLLAAEEGRLSLDDELRAHLPGYSSQGDGVTVRHLLTHTSGIVSYTSIPAFGLDMEREWTPEELVGLFQNLPLEFAPGTAWKYSNSGYFLLGLILESVYGGSYAKLLETKLFTPLQMHHSGYCDVDETTLHRAQGHRGTSPIPSTHMSGPGAAGAICSTAADLLKWTRAFQNGEVVSADLSTRFAFADGTFAPYGYGLFVGRSYWRPTISHGGNIPGFTARTARYLVGDESRDPPLDVVLLANRDSANLGGLEADLITALLGPYEHAPPSAPLDEVSAAPFVGAYTAVGLPPISIDFQGSLRASFNETPFVPLVQLSDRDFSYAPAGIFLRFVDETPMMLELEQGGGVFTLRASD